VDLDQLTDRQRAVAEKIAGGPRGNVRGPFRYLLHSPELADCAQALGAYVRYNCAVPWKLRELAILVTAYHWRAQYEWYAHESEARKAELPDHVIESMRRGERPDFTDPAEEIVYDFASELYADRRPSEATFARAMDLFGTQGVIDLAGLLGHYNLIAITLNIVDVAVPGGEKPLGD
jgi:4-carboxymuconolactone decarboxylase